MLPDFVWQVDSYLHPIYTSLAGDGGTVIQILDEKDE